MDGGLYRGIDGLPGLCMAIRLVCGSAVLYFRDHFPAIVILKQLSKASVPPDYHHVSRLVKLVMLTGIFPWYFLNFTRSRYEKIILASQSPRRKQLLEWAEVDFDVIVSDSDETYPAGLSFEEIAIHIARNKAFAVWNKHMKHA